MSSLGAYAHLAQGYGVLFCLVNAIVPDTGYAMAVTNMVMYLASIAAFWGIMHRIVPGKSRWSYLMLAAMYACSPYTLGMVNYYSLGLCDIVSVCLYAVFLAAAGVDPAVCGSAVCLLYEGTGDRFLWSIMCGNGGRGDRTEEACKGC